MFPFFEEILVLVVCLNVNGFVCPLDSKIFVFVFGGRWFQILYVDVTVPSSPRVPQVHDYGGDDFSNF